MNVTIPPNYTLDQILQAVAHLDQIRGNPVSQYTLWLSCNQHLPCLFATFDVAGTLTLQPPQATNPANAIPQELSQRMIEQPVMTSQDSIVSS